jgi:hypothetical protein
METKNVCDKATEKRLRRILTKMRERCSHKAAGKPRHYYYESGIRVCDEWNDFETFKQWAIAKGFKIGLSIDRIDNQKGYCPSNCRLANPCQQSQNQRKRCTAQGSRFKGVSPRGSRWGAKISANKVCKWLGTFQTEEQAAVAYNMAAIKLHGEYAVLNQV